MAAWTTIADASLLPGEPLTSEIALAIRDNPIAIAGGAASAPRVIGPALDLHLGTLLLTTTTPVTFTDLDDYEAIRGVMFGEIGATNQFQIAFSTNNGASFGSDQNLLTGVTSTTFDGAFILNIQTGAYFRTGVQGLGGTPGGMGSTTSITTPGGVNALRFQLSAATSTNIRCALFACGTYSP